jgi:hypothetical protein
MPNTYQLISSVTVGAGGVSTISFSSIPQTYTDLVLKLSARSSSASGATYAYIQFNGSGGTAYSQKRVYGTGSSVASNSDSNLANTGGAMLINGNDRTANVFGSAEAYIPNYTSSINKSISIDSVEENSATSQAYDFLSAALWANTSAITSITLTPESSANFTQYSIASLYGIKNS